MRCRSARPGELAEVRGPPVIASPRWGGRGRVAGPGGAGRIPGHGAPRGWPAVTWTPHPARRDDAVADLLATAFGSGPAPPDHPARSRPWPSSTACSWSRTRRPLRRHGRGPEPGPRPAGRLRRPGWADRGVGRRPRTAGVVCEALIESVHDQAVERGEPLAGLTASEGGIYRRFGYGVATRFQLVRIDAHRTAGEALAVEGTAEPRRRGGGRIRLVRQDEATAILPAVWDRHRRAPGELHRTPGLWAAEALDNEEDRGGATARLHGRARRRGRPARRLRHLPHRAGLERRRAQPRWSVERRWRPHPTASRPNWCATCSTSTSWAP